MLGRADAPIHPTRPRAGATTPAALRGALHRATLGAAISLAAAGCSDVAGPGSGPAAAVEAISPSTAARASGGFTLTVTGSGFVNGSLVRWNGVARPTVLVSATELRTRILPGDLAVAGTIPVTVVNPAADARPSKALSFTIPRRRRR